VLSERPNIQQKLTVARHRRGANFSPRHRYAGVASDKRLARLPLVPISPQMTESGRFGALRRVRSLEKSFDRTSVLNPELFVDPA
jgi:hypothetical protein